ncbi:hypothetical protein ACVQEN_15565 [Stenotrophomonas acidaminiphila]
MPWYKDWQFWAIIPAVLAIILSQIPPVRMIFRRSRLTMQVHQIAMVNHFVGLPIVQVYVTIKNKGGKAAHVKGISINVLRDGGSVFRATGETYFESTAAKDSVLFVPFDLEPEQRWSHLLNFGALLDRHEQRRFEGEKRALQIDISDKLEQRKHENPENIEVVKAEDAVVSPLLQRFDRYFVWSAGEYTMNLLVAVEDGQACEQSYRFTIFEGDEAELKSHVDSYATGSGVLFGLPTRAVSLPLELKI